jgi:SAM-dependent methyltransferase
MDDAIDDDMERLAAAAARRGIRPRSFLNNHHHIFRGVDLRGKSVLDIGSGIGLASCYAAARGAARVVSIEPEAAGSETGMLDQARSIRAGLSCGRRVEIVAATLDDSGLADRFDVVVVNDAINHFDEEACAALDRDPAARDSYRPCFEQLARLTRPGGTLILTDCSNRNFLPDIGLVNPLRKTINWRLHQPPQLWAELLLGFGFRRPRIDWIPLAGMGRLGRLVGTRRLAAYFLNSQFRLVLIRE